jgi:Glycosyltransferases involved in cell wall biogenesis
MQTATSEPVSDRSQLSQISLGIVSPMANEEATAAAFVTEVLDRCRAQAFKSVAFFAILDKKSTDRTREILEDLKTTRSDLRVVWAPENKCVVDAYVAGYREALNAGCDWILEIDAGFSHQPADITQFFDKMLAGYDCVFGSRFCKGGTMAVISRGGTILSNLFLGTALKDMTSGFELFSRRSLEHVLDRGIRSRGPFFQVEVRTFCRHLNFAEVPIQYRAASHQIGSAALKDSFSSLWRLFQLRLQGGL